MKPTSTHRRLDADAALEGLRALGLAYRPDIRQPDGLWQARCPCCAPFTDRLTLTIIESRRGGAVSLSCGARQCSRDEIATRLRDALLPPVDGRLALELAETASEIAQRALVIAADAEQRLARLEAEYAPALAVAA